MNFLPDPSSFWMAAACFAASRMTNDKHSLVMVNAGGKPFPCSRATLRNYSGYFRAILTDIMDNLDLPTVPSEHFGILLSGMQMGGSFDGLLTISNVYQILLYAQLLQIPVAVASCRNFISAIYCQYAPPPVIKPIASKPSTGHLQDIWLQHYQDKRAPKRSPTPEKTSKNPYLESLTNSQLKPLTVKTNDDRSLKASTSKNSEFPSWFQSQKLSKKETMPSGDQSGLDVASCDGPVKFHKVWNKTKEDLPKNVKKEMEGLDLLGRQSTCTSDCSPTCGKGEQLKYTHESKSKPLILRDINVQFFPCKICGAKFPSYYFVHKHKKMWHAEELLAEQQEQKKTRD